MNNNITNISIISIIVGGLISIIISTFGCQLNFIGSLIGYILIGIAMLSIIIQMVTTTTISLIKIIPFIIFTGSIIYLLSIIGTNDKIINNYTVSMDYYFWCGWALIILLFTFFIFFKEIGLENNSKSEYIYYILIILSFCFFADVIIIKNILHNNTTDEKNTCYK